mgnify:CR=1 FL=1
MEPITVKYKVLDARAKVPAYATPGAAAADLCAVLDAPLTVAPMQRVLVPTGLAIELPGAHSVALVYARSGLHGQRRGCGGQRLPRRAEGAHGQSGCRGLYHSARRAGSAAVHRPGVHRRLCARRGAGRHPARCGRLWLYRKITLFVNASH